MSSSIHALVRVAFRRSQTVLTRRAARLVFASLLVMGLTVSSALEPHGLVARLIGGSTASIANAATQNGSALRFDGQNDFVQVPNSASLPTTQVTIETWIRFASFPSGCCYSIIAKGVGGGFIDSYEMWYESGQLQGGVGRGTGFCCNYVAAAWSPGTTDWNHIALTYDGSLQRLYINGAQVAQRAPSFPMGADATPLSIGADMTGATPEYFFKGDLDEVRIWSVARTGQQIHDAMNTRPAPGTAGLAAVYHLDEGAGLIANDSSGNGNHGTLKNGPTWITAGTDVSIAGPPSVNEPGGSVTFTVTVANTGVTGVVTLTALDDDVYGNLLDHTNSRISNSTCEVGTAINSGSPYTCTFAAMVSGDAQSASQMSTTTGGVTDTVGNTATGSGSATVSILDVLPTIGFSITAAPLTVAAPSGIVMYSVTITNSGTAEAVTLIDLVDSAYGNILATSNPTIFGNTCSDNTAIGPGNLYTCSFQASVSGSVGDSRGNVVSATVTDNEGNRAEGNASATVTMVAPPNAAPTDLLLTPASVAENSPLGTTVGTFSTTDPDTVDTHTYTLVAGTGDDDNSSFTIAGASVKTAMVFDYETKSSYYIRARTTDQGGLPFEKTLIITVTDVLENRVPVAKDDSYQTIKGTALTKSAAQGVLANDTDDDNDSLTVATPRPIISPAHGTLVLNADGSLSYTPVAGFVGTDTFTYKATDDQDQSNAATATITVNPPLDSTAPAIDCGVADGAWHGSDVSIVCTAHDGGSGLANQGDASFSLSTDVSTGTENPNAATGSRQVCDVVGNCATAGPIGGNKIDRKGPSITIGAPTATTYLLNQSVTVNYTCVDGGAGPAICAGPVGSGGKLDTSEVGPKTFTVNAADAVGNTSSKSVSYTVQYASSGSCQGSPGHAILQPINADGSSVFKQGSTVPAKFRVCDASGASVGTAGTVSNFKLVKTVSGTVVSTVNESVSSTTPDSEFRWSSNDEHWIFNINTEGLNANRTYFYRVTLNDDSTIEFSFGLR